MINKSSEPSTTRPPAKAVPNPVVLTGARPAEQPGTPERETALSAVLRRDRAFNSRFVYAVRTTGVYCLPACPSRRPREENIEIFANGPAARACGYRPCKRCKPDHFAQTTRAEAAVAAALEFIDENLEEKLTLAELSAEVGLSTFYLQRVFKDRFGLSPKEYVEKKRMRVFKERLRQGGDVLDATYEAGFTSTREPYEKASRHLGMTPGNYRRGGSGVRIGFTDFASPLGRVLLAATERGICALYLSDDAKSLEAELRSEFPRATIERDNIGLKRRAGEVGDYIQGRRRDTHLTLDIIGTPFQREVWAALQAIPFGETQSYRQVAESIGNPKASRAVAGACASNRIGLLIPCHRVVRADGGLSGFRWSSERKARILELERSQARSVSKNRD
ncbi:MAG: bifunctional DNA-binding transcriptional regulator/O6-methylguanine-DNA methyltransferase Ada [Leptospirales bacterium]|jgi:AraC family transcriptional regulator of adaptative response/methylated-DNA-[protein]-cysteine methyltransferase